MEAETKSILRFDSLVLVYPKPMDSLAMPGKGEIRVFVSLSEICMLSRYYGRELDRLSRVWKSNGIRFIGFFPNPFSTDTAIRAFGKEESISFPLARDAHGSFGKSAGFSVTPEILVLYPDGKPAYKGRIDDFYVAIGRHKGSVTRRFLEDALEDLTQGKKVRHPFEAPVGCRIDETLWKRP